MAIACLFPCGDCGISCWCKNPTSPCYYYQNICETPPDDGTTFDYIISCVCSVLCVGYQSRAGTETINSVSLLVRASGAGGGFPIGVQINGCPTPICGNSCVSCGCWQNFCAGWNYNPATCLPWTWAQVNAILAGAYSCGSCCKCCLQVTQQHLEVNYNAVGYGHSVDGITNPSGVDGINPPTQVDGI